METDHCEVLCLDLETAERIRASLNDDIVVGEAANLAKAFADPLRLRLGQALSGAESLCVCDLSWIVGRSQALVSHHLRSMRRFGAVESQKQGKLVLYSFTERGRAAFLALLAQATETA